MQKIKVKNKEFLVDDEDFEWLNDLGTWFLVAKNRNYATLHSGKRIKGHIIYLHKLVLLIKYGEKVWEMDADHINGNTFDCRKENLRLVTEQQNTWNRKKKKNSKNLFIGVHRVMNQPKNGKLYIGKNWIAIMNKKYLGTAKTPEKAARIYDKECLKQRGKYATLNFPQENA